MRAAVAFIAGLVAVAGTLGLAQTGYGAQDIPVECGDTLDVPGGRYVLTHDLSCWDYDGIIIGADNVRLDLSGFTISLLREQGTPSSHAIRVGFAPGVGCVPTRGVRISGGSVTGFSGAIDLCLASNARISDMTFADNVGTGGRAISLWQSDGNTLQDLTIVRSELCGICLSESYDNLLSRIHVEDVCCYYPYSYGIVLWNSHGNVVKSSRVNDSSVGIQLDDSDRNVITDNESSRNIFGVSLIYDSDENAVTRNTVFQNSTGIYVGCCEMVAHFPGRLTIGSDNNVIRLNRAYDNARFGIAEVAGNLGNVSENNDTSGNGVADTWPPPPLPAIHPLSTADRPVVERFRACAEAWWEGIDTEARARHFLSFDDPALLEELARLKQYVTENCVGVGAALAAIPGAPETWCHDVSIASEAVSKLVAWPTFLQYAQAELQEFIAVADC